jgi:acetyltransferase-like isoleucine patch superfamily enzyme
MARSHGSGDVDPGELAACGADVVFEPGALVFHPENVEIGDGVYVGHYAILKGYYRNKLVIGAGSWIGQMAFLHAAGGIDIGARVGIGPRVAIITSSHQLPPSIDTPIMDGPIETAPVVLEDGCDIGVGAIILPGVRVGRGAQVGAGAVVTGDVAMGAVVAGSPARVLRRR